jgi:uncharacterized OB-fold protein|tara:strand:+ start:2130 stop:2546 length:417 start_codon:yes stop_codon:yes gene_type:complete
MALPPLPRPYQDTAEYWAAARDHHFVIQQCNSCGNYQFYPRGVCSHCLSSDLKWQEASGKGTVYSFSVNHRAPHPGFADDLPFVLAIVELEEGPRMMTNIVGCDPESVTIGMAVTVCFADVTDEVTLPKFQPASETTP